MAAWSANLTYITLGRRHKEIGSSCRHHGQDHAEGQERGAQREPLGSANSEPQPNY